MSIFCNGKWSMVIADRNNERYDYAYNLMQKNLRPKDSDK